MQKLYFVLIFTEINRFGTMSEHSISIEEELQKPQTRYADFQFDGARTVSGIVIRYGDIAKRFGMNERFEPGAFGNLKRADLILNVQHDRGKPVARSGSGLEVIDTHTDLSIRAELAQTSDADDTIALIKANILRGYSVEFQPDKYRIEDDTIIHTCAKLKNIGIVDRPAYANSKINLRSETMDLKEIEALITKKFAEHKDAKTEVDIPALTRSINEIITAHTTEQVELQVREQVKTQLQTALQERDEAETARKTAEDATKAAETAAEEQRAQAEEDTEKRADLLVMIKPLLAQDVETRGKSNKELMVLAVGDEVEDAENRSEDYLQAKIEGIVELRNAASEASQKPVANRQKSNASGGKVNVIKMISQRSQAA